MTVAIANCKRGDACAVALPSAAAGFLCAMFLCWSICAPGHTTVPPTAMQLAGAREGTLCRQGVTTSAVASAVSGFHILPIQKAVQYTHRPTSHLRIANKTLRLPGLHELQFAYLEGNTRKLKKEESLYGFDEYTANFEGAVTHNWVSILSSLDPSNGIVVDGGMNTGFYAVLSASMGYDVHSFDVQLDCFDVVHKILAANSPALASRAHLYHNGISDLFGSTEAGEGCDPSYNLQMAGRHNQVGSWHKRTHKVGVLPLDSFLSQKLNGKKVSILKLDIEGAEIKALSGLVLNLPQVKIPQAPRTLLLSPRSLLRWCYHLVRCCYHLVLCCSAAITLCSAAFTSRCTHLAHAKHRYHLAL